MSNKNWIVVLGEDPSRADSAAAEIILQWLDKLGCGGEPCKGRDSCLDDSNAILVGTIASNPWLKELQDAGGIDTGGVGDEGFHLRTLDERGRRLVALAGGGRLGVLYGADELSERVEALQDLDGLDFCDRPHFALRANKMLPPLKDDYIAKRRINTIYLPTWLPVGTDFSGIYIGLKVMEELVGLTPGQWKDLEYFEQRALQGRFDHLERFSPEEIEQQTGLYRQRIRELTELGVRVYISRYEWAFPLLTLARNYFEEEAVKGGSKHSAKGIQICMSSEIVRKIIRLVYEKTFELFPELSGVVVYTSAEGGFGVPCSCGKCQALYEDFRRDLPLGYQAGGLRKDRGGPDVQFFHKHAFDLAYEAIRSVRKDAEIIRNSWDFQPIKAPLGTDYIDRYTPRDVVFMPYTESTDTNLREGPNPQVVLWTERGRKVAPKMCQLVEMHPRSNNFPNDITDRIQHFYRTWGEASVYGMCLHGGWYAGDRFGKYEAMEDNIGFGFNLLAHWKLLWNPFREDLDKHYLAWAKKIYGGSSAETVIRCLRRAGRIYRFGPQVDVARNPTYRDYLAYAAKADGAGGNKPIGYMGFLYPFGFDNILLQDKLTHKFFVNPAFLHSEFIYNYEDYEEFCSNLNTAYEWLDASISELKRDLEREPGSEPLRALIDWFEVERDYLSGFDVLYRGEKLYLIEGDLEKASQAYGRAHDLLHDALVRWGRIALAQDIWPFNMDGHFYPYRDTPVDHEGKWVDEGAFGTFFTWLKARHDDPGGPDVIVKPRTGDWHFHNGLKKFRWPME